MDLQDQRMQCLKMAFDLHGNPDTVLAAAQRMLDFVTGSSSQTSATEDTTAPIASEFVAPAAVAAVVVADAMIDDAPAAALVAAEASVADPIAACGTALVMPEGGNLEDAVTADVAAVEAVAEATEAAAMDASVAEAPSAEPEAIAADGMVEIADDMAVEAAPVAEAETIEAEAAEIVEVVG
ncbi:MAG: hypothetical protein ACKVOP_12645, partial [Sphingomonadaceae bacterium]